MKIIVFLTLLCVFIDFAANAQPIFAFRSAQSGNWNQPSTWESTLDGIHWTPATSTPDATDPGYTITIRNGHIITVNTNVNAIALTVEPTAILRTTTGILIVANGIETFDLICNGTFEILGGSVIGPGTIQMNNVMNWSGGILGASCIIETGANLQITAAVTLQNIITINGTATHTGGNVAMQNGTILINNIWNENPGSNVQFVNSSGTNLITISASATFNMLGFATTTNNILMNILGSLDVQSGIFRANSATTCSGTLNIEDPGTVECTLTFFIEEPGTVTGEGDFKIIGSFYVLDDVVLAHINLYLLGGTIDDQGTGTQLNIVAGENEDDMIWTAGTVACDLTVEAGANLIINGNVYLLDDLTVAGSATHLGGNISCNNARIDINDLAIWTTTNSTVATVSNTSGTNIMVVDGTCEKNEAGQVNTNIQLIINGTINVHAGIYNCGNMTTVTGDVVIDPGAVFRNSSTINLGVGCSFGGGGTLDQAAGAMNVNTAVTTPPTMIVNFTGGITVGTGIFTLGGIGNLGNVSFDNPVVVGDDATLNITDGNATLKDQLTVNGNVYQATGFFMDGATVDVTADATWTTSNSTVATVTNVAGSTNEFEIVGVYNQNTISTVTINVPVIITGTWNVNAGTCVLGNATTCTGDIIIDAGCTLQKTNTFNFETGSSVGGAGNFNQTGGTTNFNTNVTVPATLTTNITGGITTGPSICTFEGICNAINATLDNPIVVANGATFNINGANTTFKDQFTVNGNVYQSTGFFMDGATIDVTASAVWTSTNTTVATISNVGSSVNQFNVSGTHNETGTGTLNMNAPATYSGTLNVMAGIYNCANTTVFTGDLDVDPGTIFRINSTVNLNPGFSVTGGGSVNLASGTLMVNTPVFIPHGITLNITGGTTEGTFPVTDDGPVIWNGGTISNPFIIDDDGTAEITADVTLGDDFTNNGHVHQYKAIAVFSDGNGVDIINNVTWETNNSSIVTVSNNGAGNDFINNGTHDKNGTGILNMNLPATHNGPLNVNEGVYNCGNITTIIGNVAIAIGATLRNSSTANLNPGCSFSGGGTLSQVAGTMNVNTGITFPASVTVNISGGAANGSSASSILGTLNWGGGLINFPIEVNIANITADVSLYDELKIEGTANHSGGNISFNGGGITNNGSWTSFLSSAASFINVAGTNFFTNNNTFYKSGTAPLFNNVATTSNGPLNVQAGKYVAGNTHNVNNNLDISTSATVEQNNILNFNPGASATGPGTYHQISGTTMVSTPVNLGYGVVILAGGVIDGPSPVTIQNTMNASGGTISCPLVIANVATLNFTAAATVVLNDILTNNGTTNFYAQALNFAGGIINNIGILNLNATSSSGFGNTSGTNQLTNSATGVINKNNATTHSNHVQTVNLGSFFVNAGIYAQQNNITHTGNLNIAGVTSKFLCNGIFICGLGNNINGSGILTMESGTMDMQAPTTIPANVTFELNGFAKTIGTSLLTIGQRMFWAGEIGSPVKIAAQAVLDMVGAPTLKNHLTLEGIGNLPNVAVNFANGIFEIISNGSLNVISNGGNSTFGSVSGTNQFYIRAGAFLRKSGAQFFANFIPTDVEGEWETLDGTSLQHGILNVVGKLKVAANKIMRFSEACTANFNTGAQAEGTGMYEFNGVTNFNALFEFLTGSNVTFEKGTMQGTGPVKLGGVTEWRGGNFKVDINIPTGGEVKLTSVNLPKFTERTMDLQTNATFRIQQGGSLDFDNATVKVAGTLIYSPPPGSNFTLNNTSGTNKIEFLPGGSITGTSPTSVINVNVPITSMKKVSGLGTSNFNGPIPSGGYYPPGMSPGIMTINSTSPLFGDSSTLEIEILDGSGAGTGHDQLQRNGNLVLDGTLNVTQTGTVPLGTYTIINLTSGTISGSFDVLNLPPGYSSGQTTNTFYVSKDTNALWQFRSKQTGNWNDISTWETSINGVAWSNATQAPTLINAELITIRNPHIITLTANTTVKKLVLETGAFLNVLTGTLFIFN